MTLSANATLPATGPHTVADSDSSLHAALDGSLRCVLGDRGILAFRGADAAAFLHRQLSTDVAGLEPGDTRLTSYSDARGRLLFVGRLYAEPERLLLEVPAERLEPLKQTLARFVLRADVHISDASAELARCGVTGQNAAMALHSLTGKLPSEPGESCSPLEGLRVVRLPGPRVRWALLGEPAAVQQAWDALEGHAATGGVGAWRLLEIEAGIPHVHEATAGHFVAQMLNLDRLGAIDFDKGCYPGQEVIARTHYLGRVKRRMQLLYAPACSEPPAPAAPVSAAGSRIGEVVDAAATPDGGALVLATLQLDASGPFALGEAANECAERRDLPYSLADEAA